MFPTTLPSDRAKLSIETLYETHRGALLAHLRRLVADPMAAEDLCQETFLKALRAWSAQPQILNAQAWLYRIATNSAYDYLRRSKRLQFTPLSATPDTISAGDSMESACTSRIQCSVR